MPVRQKRELEGTWVENQTGCIGKEGMDYQTALAIARSNPGFIVRCTAGSAFVVLQPDGSPIPPPNPDDSDAQANTVLSWNVQRLREQAYAQLADAQDKIACLNREVQHLRAQLLNERADRALAGKAFEEESAMLSRRVRQLEEWIAKVSPEERKRIDNANDVERAAHAEALRAQRHLVDCACQGEVENCARCSGRGDYN